MSVRSGSWTFIWFWVLLRHHSLWPLVHQLAVMAIALASRSVLIGAVYRIQFEALCKSLKGFSRFAGGLRKKIVLINRNTGVRVSKANLSCKFHPISLRRFRQV